VYLAKASSPVMSGVIQSVSFTTPLVIATSTQ
jgi:hypothetical protein